MTDQPRARTQDRQALRYRVPDAQDPVVVTAALSAAGYRTEIEHSGAAAHVLIDCPAGSRAREQVRELIASDADTTSLEGPRFERHVTFDDEA
jgi:hypothetical protein